jgi:hypothetical protein
MPFDTSFVELRKTVSYLNTAPYTKLRAFFEKYLTEGEHYVIRQSAGNAPVSNIFFDLDKTVAWLGDNYRPDDLWRGRKFENPFKPFQTIPVYDIPVSPTRKKLGNAVIIRCLDRHEEEIIDYDEAMGVYRAEVEFIDGPQEGQKSIQLIMEADL